MCSKAHAGVNAFFRAQEKQAALNGKGYSISSAKLFVNSLFDLAK